MIAALVLAEMITDEELAYYETYEDYLSCNSCTDCDLSCATCDGSFETHCLTCYPGAYLTDDDEPVCADCDSNCDECSGEATTCTACAVDWILYDGTCVSACPDGTYFDDVTC